MTERQAKAIERAIGAIEGAKKDAKMQCYVQALMSHETALAELRALLEEHHKQEEMPLPE